LENTWRAGFRSSGSLTPPRQTVTVYRSLTQTEQFGIDGTLTAEPVLPGCSVEVRRFF